MRRVPGNIKQNLLLLLFILARSILSYNPFYNYTSSIRVNDIAIGDFYVWAATNGGLMRINPSTDHVQLRNGTEKFPDLNLTALCFDTLKNLWVGTDDGYLYKITPKDRHSVYTSYYSSEWRINDIYSFGNYLIIASSKGCSVFDIKDKKVLQNAAAFGNFKEPTVHTITVYKNTLYLGCSQGVAKLDISGGKLLTENFLDKNIWTTDFTKKAVVSFPVLNDSLLYMDAVSTVIDSSLCYTNTIKNIDGTEKNYVYRDRDTSVLLEFSSKITSIIRDGGGYYWFGTEEDYIKRWDKYRIKDYRTEGLTFRNIKRVYIAKDNSVWCTPYVFYKLIGHNVIWRWWLGLAKLEGDKWTFYRPSSTPDFGKLGDGEDFTGIAEGPLGNMWFGLNGPSIKKFNPSKNRWDGYAIGYEGGSTFQFKPQNKDMRWGKCDAIVQDSSGYMWFTAFNSFSGSVICYDPAIEIPSDTSDTISYRYFFPKESQYHFFKPDQLNVDVAGNIFMGGGHDDEGKLIIFRYDKGSNPLTDGINDPVLNVKLTKIWHMVSTEDTITWIVSLKGLYLYKYNKTSDPLLLKVKNAPENASCIEVESSYRYHNQPLNTNDYYEKIETVMWLGTQFEGIARVNVHHLINSNGTIDSIGVDSISYLKKTDGLISNTITHMDLDKKNGYLWIATDEGLSRYYIGHSFEKLENNRNVSAYPNPYSLSRHSRIIFEKLAPGSSISIYTVDGRLVADIRDKEGNVVKTGNEWTFTWKPDRDIIPGVYFYIAKREQEYELNKKRGIAGKLLFLP